jgi:hypothetical protein
VVASSSLTVSNITVTNNLTINGNSNHTGLSSFLLASTTNLSVFNNAWFGGTATSTFNSSGFLGIGSSTPWGMLSIQVPTNGTTDPLFIVASSTGASSTPYFTIAGNGNVGLGTTTPFEQFTVVPASTTISLVGSAALSGGSRGQFLAGRYLYIVENTTGSGSLEIWDVSNPASPIRVGGGALNNTGRAIYVQGHYAYIGNSNGSPNSDSFEIWDVSNPAAPSRVSISSAKTNGVLGVTRIYVQGRYAYLSTSLDTEIWDVSNPYAPVQTSAIPSAPTYGMSVSGRYLYDVSGTSNFEIWDVSNPYSPIRVGSFRCHD